MAVQSGRPKAALVPAPGTFKKGEDGVLDRDSLLRENTELKRLLYECRQENKKLRSQLHHVSIALDHARSEGFGSIYDVRLGIDRLKEIDERAAEEPAQPAADNTAAAGAEDGADPQLAGEAQRDRRRFAPRFEFVEHQGSVYCARFSTDGNLIASGSFDQTVRVYDVKETQQRHRLDGHSLVVSDISWSNDSQSLVSCSFDTTCRVWDVTQGRTTLECCVAQHFLLSITVNKVDPHTFFTSSSEGSIFWIDRRVGRPQGRVVHGCMVNSLHVVPGGQQLLAGDKEGVVTVWDLRALRQRLDERLRPDFSAASAAVSQPAPSTLSGPAASASSPVDIASEKGPAQPKPPRIKTIDQELHESEAVAQGPPDCVLTRFTLGSHERPGEMAGTALRDDQQHGQSRRQITHVHTPVIGPKEIVGRYIAMTSYDNVLRLYDRGSFAVGGGEAHADVRSDNRSPRLVQRLIEPGMRFSGFPIKSCFWCGEDAARVGDEARDGDDAKPRSFKESVLLATGSAGGAESGNDAFVFDISDVVRRGGSGGSAQLLQRLHGHKDTVYGVHCHPKLPWFLTYSADYSVKVWSPLKTGI
eukprot:TRINITY_DN50859_c0_g1_i1.p1 TRINITY_DN50859_c0_g1~~TRINITY_DN50859_c0_g1_i1.p1  ORF type:complete len:586 (+),score=186.51 TRINITY_DN50859_c0_g1_i1:79-1836(+)